jgi:vacuolar-type H+-ATPase subunit F/Vma7
MARAAVIGETSRVQGYALAGAVVYLAEDEAAVRTAWQALPADVEVVIVTARAAAWLGGELTARPGPLPVVMPG